MTEAVWIYGATGVGKSHHAFEGYDPATHYIWSHDKGWWDGYNGHPIVIMNDYRGEIAYNNLLKLIDRWPEKVSRRGREPTQFLAKKVIITSSLSPSDVYKNRMEEDKLEQLLRRCEVIHMKEKEEEQQFVVESFD